MPCKAIAMWNSNKWGTTPVRRGAAKTAAVTLALPAIGVGAGVMAVGAGCVATGGCLAIPVVTLVSIGRLMQQTLYYLRSMEYPVIVHMPWNRRVSWIESQGDGDGEGGNFLGYEGRHHPSGIFVARAKLRADGNRQGFKKWLKYGPRPFDGNVKVVFYFVPNGTSRTTLANMLPFYDMLPMVSRGIQTYIYIHN